jgi:hypothetical protein
MNRFGFGVALVAMAALGTLLGQSIQARSASACDCTPHTWELLLVEVGSSGPGTTGGWPDRALLTAYAGSVSIDAVGGDDDQVFRAEAKR